MTKHIEIKEAFGELEMVPVDSIHPAAYNPRKVFENRLHLVFLSLSRFGFLLPIYIDQDGEILSGHQRHHIATTRLNARFLPVVRTRKLSKPEARSLNLIFNRATNDMVTLADSEPLSKILESSDIPRRVAELPMLNVESDDFFPIKHAVNVKVTEILDKNPVWEDNNGIKMSLRLAATGETEIMPIVLTKNSWTIVNGKARAAAAGKVGKELIKATFIPDEHQELASGLLNLLSMRYEVEGTLADDLRANAFRAAPSVRHSMSVNSTYEVTGDRSPKRHFDPGRPEHRKAWVEHYGPNVLDFGAGNYLDATNMEEMGANAAAFEPYFKWDRLESQDAAEKWFFSRIVDGREFNSIFLSNVMNTVPFEGDRRKVVAIIAALCSENTIVYSSSRHICALAAKAVMTTDRAQISDRGNSIRISGEVGTKITNVGQKPAIQKFHSKSDLAQLWATQFRHVEARETSSYAMVRAWGPKPVDPAALVQALEFEFNLPFVDGTRFDRHERAIEVFSKRLGIDLSKYRKLTSD